MLKVRHKRNCAYTLIDEWKIQRQEQKRSDLDEQLKEYIAEWRKQRAKEEEELKRLKVKWHIFTYIQNLYILFFCNISGDITSEENACSQEKQAKRKITRADEEKRLAQKKKEEEERRQREIGKPRNNSSPSFKKKALKSKLNQVVWPFSEEKKQRDIEEKRRYAYC